MVEVGSRIKKLRKSQKITQTEFASRLGVTKSAISSYENGSRLPSYDILIKISRIFKVSTDYLLGCVDEKAQTVNVSGLSDKQIASIRDTVDIYRAFNEIRNQVHPDVQKFLDDFVERETWDGKLIFPEE